MTQVSELTEQTGTMNQQSLRNLPRPRIVGLVGLIVLWVLFAYWQRREHVHQCHLIQDTLSSQGEALSSAVGSGIRSHRWFGPFVQQQLPTTLETLARSTKVLAIAVVVNDDLDQVYFAGDKQLVAFELPEGQHAVGTTLQVVHQFEKQNVPPMRSGFAAGDQDTSTAKFRSFVVLDRSETIAQFYAEARNRILIFVLGSLLLAGVAVVWWFTVQLTQSEGRTRLLQAQSRHLHELGLAAAGLAHETRNPLGLIRGWTQQLVDSGLPDTVGQQQADLILEECDRVTARINQFLAFARQAELNVQPLSLADLVDELLALLQPDLDAKRLTLIATGLDTPNQVQADLEQLRQVLFNLLQNAIAFAPDGSNITLSMQGSKQGTSRLEITDEGPGIPDEIVDQLFEPYVTRRPGGTGLGLSIVRRIAIAHGWEVGYRPRPEGGSVFWIDGILPAQ